jgi:hypothetical protein
LIEDLIPHQYEGLHLNTILFELSGAVKIGGYCILVAQFVEKELLNTTLAYYFAITW